MVLFVAFIVIIIPWVVVVVPLVMVVVEVPLFVECRAMYETIVVKVFVELFVAHVVVAIIIVDGKFFFQSLLIFQLLFQLMLLFKKHFLLLLEFVLIHYM